MVEGVGYVYFSSHTPEYGIGTCFGEVDYIIDMFYEKVAGT